MKSDTRSVLLDDRWGKARYVAVEVEQAAEVAHLLPKNEPSFAKLLFNFHMAISGLGLVRPFDWMKWEEPSLTAERAKTLPAEDIWRHATRVIRGERFCEGLFEAHVFNGSLVALVRRAYEVHQTNNGWPTAFAELDDADLETGIEVEGLRSREVGTTTGFREQRPNAANPGWNFQVLWDDGSSTMEDMNNWHLVVPMKKLVQLSRKRR